MECPTIFTSTSNSYSNACRGNDFAAVLELLEKEQQLNRVIKNQSSKEIKELVIKGIPSISQYQAFNVITDFAKQYPDVNLKFSEAETDTLLDTLDDGNADIVFTRLFGNKQLHHDMLINDQDYFVALMPKIHPLAGYKKN